MYKRPIVEKRSIAEFCSKILRPKGPITTPETISPIIPGILILRNNIKNLTKPKNPEDSGFSS